RERGEREQGGAGHEQAPAPEQISGPPAEQQQAPEAEQVGAQHPLEVARRERQVGVDRRQRDHDDRGVEDDHEERGAEQRERLPAARIRLCGSGMTRGGWHRAKLPSSPKKGVRLTTLGPTSSTLVRMATMRTYGDGCGIAHALDLVGERWALLVVRELLL